MADIKESGMGSGTPTKIRALDANGNSISPSISEVNSVMPMATLTSSGMTGPSQARYSFVVNANSSLILLLPHYGMYLLVNEQISGDSLLFYKSYYNSGFKILLDPSSIHGKMFRLDALEDGFNNIKITNLSSTIKQRFSINRL